MRVSSLEVGDVWPCIRERPRRRIHNMSYGDRAREAISPELRGLSVKECRTVVISGSLAFKPTYQLISRLTPSRLASDARGRVRTTRTGADTAQLPTRSSPASPSTHRRATCGGNVPSTPLAAKAFHETRVQQNDLVVFANHAGTWKVVAPVNGSKADIRRSGGFDTRIVTAPLEILTVVRRVGSPGCTY